MFTSAINYLAGAASSVAGGSAPVIGEAIGGIGQDDPLVGSVIEVGEIRVFIRRRIGEGGFAFVYHAEDMTDRTRTYALKRLLAMDAEKRGQIIQEIAIMKGLSSHEHIVTFVTAATVDASTRVAAGKCDEFLVLMEFCPKNLADIIRTRSKPYPPATVAKIFCQLVHSVAALHNSTPPIIHRDLKLENLLVDSSGKKLKLCDFGSATTRTYQPTAEWSMGQRTTLEDEMARHTTPMYRAPEMLDMWANFPIDTAADVWALGCTLFFLCFHQHPFEDSAKLAIVNGNYRMPTGDFTYTMFHDLIKQMLVVDPSCRPTCNQVLQHLSSVSADNGIDLTSDIDFELSSSSASSPLYDMSPQEHSSTATPSPQHKPGSQGQLPVNAPPAAGGVGLMSSLRGGAGTLIHKLRDTSKAVIQSVSVAGRGLDLHCITERVAAMSYPSDGFESAIRHHIDDVSSVIENCHANHYAVVNLTERRYNVAKFQTGVVMEAGWKTTGPTSLSVVLETVEKCLKFLQKDPQNVIVVHCLDGKTNSAVLVAAILLACKFVTSFNDGLKFFELKRCAPHIENYHKTILKYVEKAFNERHIVTRGVTITSLILEPVPNFSKQGDGCRPFVQLVRTNQGEEIITVPSTDFNSLQPFTAYDEEAVLKLNVKVNGDVTIAAFHARQTFGGLFSKMDGVLICKIYFHTGFLPTTGSSLRLRLRELDGVSSGERFGPEFKAVVNYRFEKDPAQTRAVNADWDLSLIFNSKSDYEMNRSMMFGDGTPPLRRSPSPPPQAPPRTHRAPPVPPKPEIRSRTPTPPIEGQQSQHRQAVVEDLLIEPSFDDPPSSKATPPPLPPKLVAEVSPLTRPASDTLLLDLGFGGSSNHSSTPSVACTNPSIDILLNLSGSGAAPQTQHQEDPFYKPASQVKTVSSSADLFGSVSGNSRASPIPDLFGATNSRGVPMSASPAPDLFGSTNSRGSQMPDLFSGTQSASQMPDLFGTTKSRGMAAHSQMPDLFGTATNAGLGSNRGSPIPDLFGGAASNRAQAPDLFSDSLLNLGAGPKSSAGQKPVLSPTCAKPMSVGDELLSNLLGDLDMKSNPGQPKQQPQSQGGVKKPNYNSSFFQQPQQQHGTKPKGKLTEDTFNDLLGGFSATSNGGSGGSKTIGEMKKKEEIKFMDPNEARVYQWKEGKSRNLRALLCSLDTIIWQDSRWTVCGMHQLVTQSDVKRMYKKACLAVHPDKQAGTVNAELAKLIFMELNDAWSEFEKQQEQLGI